MAVPWPASPNNGDTFTYNDVTYTWNGLVWLSSTSRVNNQQIVFISNAAESVYFDVDTTPKSMLTDRVGYTIPADTTYEYDFYTAVSVATGGIATITPTISLGFTTVSGSPTIDFVSNISHGNNTTGFTTATTLSSIRTTSKLTLTASGLANRYYIINSKGTIRLTGGSAKVYPTLSGTVNVDIPWVIESGTTFKLLNIGSSTATSNATFD